MCNLCGTEKETRAARDFNVAFADNLERLAAKYRDLAYGRLKPHTEEMKRVGPLAHSIIRHLVEEWV